MKIEIEINCENDSFQDDPSAEVCRILRLLIGRIDGHPHFSPGAGQPLADVNGNEVGWFGIHD